MKLFRKTLSDRIVSYLPDEPRERATHTALFMLANMGLRRMPVVLMQGATRPTGRPGTLLTAGHDPWIRYLPGRFFCSEPARKYLGTVSFRELPGYVDRFCNYADLIVFRVNRWSVKRFFRHKYLAVPEWVGMRLELPVDLEQLVRSGNSIKNDMALVRRHKFRPVVLRGTADFDKFYHSVYAPYSYARHGETTFIRGPHDLRRRLSKGGILWVEREGKRAAAILFQLKARTLDILALGTLNGDLSLVRAGALAAGYYFVIRHAQDLGCTTVDFRGSRPSLRDGLLRYKNKWSASLYEMNNCYYDLLVSWENPNQIVRDFFAHTPLIFRENGRLSALSGDGSGKTVPFWINGLHRIYLMTESGCRLLHSERPGH